MFEVMTDGHTQSNSTYKDKKECTSLLFSHVHVLCFGGNILALFCTRALNALYERQKVKGLLSEQTNLKLNLVTSFIPI